MGRLSGALNKKYKKSAVVGDKKKRGRPKKVVVPLPVLPVIETREMRFLGFCKCKFMITKNEKVSKTAYECPGCGKRNDIKKLTKELESSHKGFSKKEYLENTINAEHIGMPSLNEHEVNAKELKVRDS